MADDGEQAVAVIQTFTSRRRSGRSSRRWDSPTTVGRVVLRNPVMASSGTYGYGLEYRRYGDPSALGAIVVKSLTVDPRPGFATPRVTLLDDPGTMINAVGVPNPGVRTWGETILPEMRAAGCSVVASVWGLSAQEVVDAAAVLSRYPGPVAWEANLSCPNSDHGGSPVSHDPESAAAVCRELRSLAPDEVGIWAKLSPDAPDVASVAASCRDAGADAVVLTNTMPARTIGVAGPIPLGGGPGGMSGAGLREYVRPLVEKVCADVSDVAVVACGGVLDSSVALDYLSLGASAVAVGTASLYDPRACHKIARAVVAARTAP